MRCWNSHPNPISRLDSIGTNKSALSPEVENEIDIEKKVKTVIQYYIRKNSNWVKTDEVDDTAFISSNTLFCNLKDACVKDPHTSVCDTQTNIKKLEKLKYITELTDRSDIIDDREERMLEEAI
jgi:hypothetical protein